MTDNNVVPLFAAVVASSAGSDDIKNEASATLLSKLASLDLETQHPATGLKYGGYMPISCIVFVPELFLLLNPGEMKLLMYLTFLKWRYAEKSQYVRAALPYLSEGVGISRSTIYEYLIRLEEMKLLECIEVNQKIGNLYWVTDLTLWNPTQERKVSEPQQSGIQTTTIQNSDDNSPKNSRQPSENRTKDYSSLSFYNPFQSLSQHKGFNARWETLTKKAAKKEREAIKALLGKNPDDLEEIYQALIEVEKTGKTYNGEICHSPIGLITSSWPTIKRIRADRKAQTVPNNSKTVESNVQEERDRVLLEVRRYVDSLEMSDLTELHLTVENEIKRQRPKIQEIRKDTLIFQSFLESIVAAKLGLELPESN